MVRIIVQLVKSQRGCCFFSGLDVSTNSICGQRQAFKASPQQRSMVTLGSESPREVTFQEKTLEQQMKPVGWATTASPAGIDLLLSISEKLFINVLWKIHLFCFTCWKGLDQIRWSRTTEAQRGKWEKKPGDAFFSICENRCIKCLARIIFLSP